MREFNEYQRHVSQGVVTPECSKGRMLMNVALGLNGYAAEYTELLTLVDPTTSNLASELQRAAMKYVNHMKESFTIKGDMTEKNRASAKKCLGDLLRYSAAAATVLGFELQEVVDGSINE